MDKKVRMNIVLPTDLAKELKKAVEKRRWSDFVSEAIKEKIARTRLEAAISQTSGSLGEKTDEQDSS